MPAKRKAAQKPAPPAESTRPSRSTAGTKRKASPSPAPPAKKGVGARKEASDHDAKESPRQSARGRSASKQTDNKQKEEPKARGGSKSSHATRAAVEAVESKRASSRARSKTPSTPQKTNAAPKSTPKSKSETPKQKTTPRAATPRQRSATPKSKPATPKQATPKQKAATPKQKAATLKQKNTPKQKAATPKPKQEKQKSTPKQKPTPKQKQTTTPVKSPSKRTPQKKEESPKKNDEGESPVEPDTKKSPDSAKKRRTPTKRETPPAKPARASSRSRGKEEKADEDKEIDKDEQTDKTEEETTENTTKSDAAEAEAEQKLESEDKPALKDEKDEKDKPNEKDEVEEMETEEAANEDENVEQDQIVEKSENTEADAEEAVEESKAQEATEEQVEAESPQEGETTKEKVSEDVVAEAKEVEEDEAMEEAEAVEDEEPAEDESKGEAEAVQEPVIEPQSEEKEESIDPEVSSVTVEPPESVHSVEDVKESQAESEQVVLEDKENESVESEQVEADAQEPKSDAVAGGPIVINEDSGDSAQPEVISDESDNGEGKVIELNDDSGDAVILMDSNEQGGGDNDNFAKVNDEVQVLDAEAEPPVVNLDDDTGVELGEEAIENDFASTSDLTGNGTSHQEDVESKKRKIDEVEDAEESGEFSKKVKSSVEVEGVTENGTVSQEGENIDDEFVVIEMSDVPPTDSNEVKESIPQEVVTNNIDTDNIANPIFNREYIPNPAFSGSGDISKQFSVVSYNILADCHLFRNDYSFTESKYLVPEYRLEKIIEELKYLDGDIICMQEVDPTFFSEKLLPSLQSIGYEGFHKKRTTEYFNEGEATFYKTGRFTLVECQLHRQADLVESVLSEGAVDAGIQEAVRKYVDMPDVLVVTKLRCNNTGSELTVGNVHINWGEMKTPDIQCVQVASAIKETVNKAGSEGVPHIICGDFNSPPLSPGYVVARDGYPNGDDTITKLQQIAGLQLPDGKIDSLVNCLWPAFQHTSSALKSAYFEVQGQEPEITSYNQVMCECVDYIFYSSTSIDNVGVYRVPAKDKIMETGGTPNLYFPSDHVSMKAVLSFK